MIKNITVKTAVAALLVVGSLSARTLTQYTDKTFLAPRAQNANLAMEYTTWHRHPFMMHDKTMKTHLQIAPFWQESKRERDLGKYFGVNGQNAFKIDGTIAAGTYIIQDRTNSAISTIKLSPRQRMFGSRVELFQDVNTPFKGLFFRLSAPVVHVENDMQARFTNETPANAVAGAMTFSKFFRGDSSNPQQVSLNKARMSKRTATGVADLDISLGAKLRDSEQGSLLLSIDGTVPTGTRVRGNYVFEPVCGNGHHFGLGGSMNGSVRMWHNDVGSVRLVAAIRYKYLFESSEARTFSADPDAKFGQYYKLGNVQQPHKALLTPAANVLTLPIAIKPGHQFDALAAFSFHSNGFTIDGGYNMFFKDAEHGKLNSFADSGKYVVAKDNFNPTTNPNTLFGSTPAADYAPEINTASNNLITKARLEAGLSRLLTPASLTHKVFGGVGHTSKIYDKHDLSFGLGASYEFAMSNADLENYAVWGKMGVSF